MTQNFKGDPLELKMIAAGQPAFAVCESALDDFNQNSYIAADFLLMLYDSGRMPFSDRVPRESFVTFFRQAIVKFPFTGTFECYIFILTSIFGDGSTILFNIPAAGKLDILVNAASTLSFDFIFREFIGGAYVFSNFTDDDDNPIQARAISGIDSEYRLNLLLDEILPAGVFTDVSLSFYSISNFIDDAGDLMLDSLGNQFIFFEV